MAIAAVAPEQEKKNDAFDKETKVTGDEWLILTLLTSFVVVFSFVIFFSKSWVGSLICIVLVVMLTSVVISLFWAFILVHRNYACSQCFQLAEEISFHLSQEQVIQLQRKGTGGWVFWQFVGMIPSDRLAQPKDNYFAVGNWDNPSHCRRFVSFLHGKPDVFLPEPVRSTDRQSAQPEEGSET